MTSAAAPTPGTMTVEQWCALDEDEPGELVDGVLEEEEVPDFVHEIVVGWFVRTLGNWVAARGGVVVGSEAKYALSPQRGRKPDASLYFPGSRLPSRRGAVRRPPDLMIEVLSPTSRDVRRDRIAKAADYASFGVKHYWLVDPEARTIEGFALGGDGRYVRAFAAGDGRLGPPGFEGLELDLDGLWAEVDRLPEE